ncbi:MAG: hypothetical protein WDN25_22670 [Acetobacteraceae bacterium]
MLPPIDPWLAAGVVVSTMATDAAYVLFNGGGVRPPALRRGDVEQHLVPALGVRGDQLHVVLGLCAVRPQPGSWVGAFLSMTWLRTR